jgi:hypothetical protein
VKNILFSTPMVKAIQNTKPGAWPAELADPEKPFKWQTRRVIKTPVCADKNGCLNIKGFWVNPERDTGTALSGIAPYSIGDILWVREAFAKTSEEQYLYRADPMFDHCGKGDFGWNWSPSIHMPREAARIFLEVKDVRVERLREITPEDKKKEGFSDCHRAYPCAERNECGLPCFMKGWDGLNAKRGYGWAENPYVYVYEFMRLDLEAAQVKEAT